jgi:hypothetical protein
VLQIDNATVGQVPLLQFLLSRVKIDIHKSINIPCFSDESQDLLEIAKVLTTYQTSVDNCLPLIEAYSSYMLTGMVKRMVLASFVVNRFTKDFRCRGNKCMAMVAVKKDGKTF